MAYNIEFRPKTFNEIIGNRDTVESLQSLLQQKDPPHTFLFSGLTGCGKTTLARIVANELGCSEYDRIELNSSNNRGIDTARDIISQMSFKPLQGKCKVYILDEVHATTKDFQHAMLKALEDAPKHVFFILCTTEPEKLLKTILNRCSRFEVHKLNIKMIMRLLDNVLSPRKIKINIDVLEKIAEESEGIPRQALIMLQQIIGIKEADKAIKIIQSIKTDQKQVIDLCRALNEGRAWNQIAGIIKSIEAEPESIRRAVLGYFTTIALNSKDKKTALRSAMIIENFTDNYYDSGKAGLILSAFRSVMQ
ncbi:MAG: AAA family ATPase [Melioribacteraceae bacterium]|jgi:DNA polymerase III subunit gamma/tau|nr:AAA family ATPase [Melioribacteraceae bacterium]